MLLFIVIIQVALFSEISEELFKNVTASERVMKSLKELLDRMDLHGESERFTLHLEICVHLVFKMEVDKDTAFNIAGVIIENFSTIQQVLYNMDRLHDIDVKLSDTPHST